MITASAVLVCVPALAAARPRTTFITYSGTYEDTVPIAFSTQDPTGIPGDVSTAEIHWGREGVDHFSRHELGRAQTLAVQHAIRLV